MADNVVKVHIVADSTKLDKSLMSVKEKIYEAMKPSAFSLREINPWKLGADAIMNAVRGAYESIRNFSTDMVAHFAETRKAASSLTATAAEYTRLSDAAERAGVRAEDFADAIERIKDGETTLEDVAEQWERIAEGAGKSASNISNVARLRSYMEKHETQGMNLAQYVWANWTGDYQAGQALGRLMGQVNNGRRTMFTIEEVMDEVWGKGIRERPLGDVSAGHVFAVMGSLNKEIYDRERLDAKERQAELERRRKEEEAEAKKAEELRKKANEALEKRLEEEYNAEVQRLEQEERDAKDLYALYEKRKALVGDEAAQKDIIAELKIGRKRLTEMLKLGEELTLTPEERFRRQTDAIAKQQNEQAQAKEKAERERQQERQRAQAERDRLTERAEDLRKRADEVEGELNASWLTASGGSLIGNGAFSLAMGQRMRDIDRAEKQAELLQELHGVNEKLAQLVKNTNE